MNFIRNGSDAQRPGVRDRGLEEGDYIFDIIPDVRVWLRFICWFLRDGLGIGRAGAGIWDMGVGGFEFLLDWGFGFWLLRGREWRFYDPRVLAGFQRSRLMLRPLSMPLLFLVLQPFLRLQHDRIARRLRLLYNFSHFM